MSDQGTVTAREIAEALNITQQAVAKRAADGVWAFVEQTGRGGKRRLYVIDNLPQDVREAITQRRSKQQIELARAMLRSAGTAVSTAVQRPINSPITPPTRPATTAVMPLPQQVWNITPTARHINDLNDYELSVGTARAAVLDELARIAATVGERRAAGVLLDAIARNDISAEMLAHIRTANARAGDTRTLSGPTLWQWRDKVKGLTSPADRVAALAPRSRGKRYDLMPDEAAVLALRQQPNKPSLAHCVKQVLQQLDDASTSENALAKRVKRQMQKLPAAAWHFGRHTGAALKALKVFIRREFDFLLPNQVWVGDGHAMKMRVAHPETGKPFVPELTVILDVQSRFVVGWSVALAENVLAVADALRHGVAQHGLPLIYYSDNGAGQTGKYIDADCTGILRAMDITHHTGIAGNPQGRGVMERWWKTVAIPFAQRFATYRGHGADRDTLRRTTIEIQRQIKAIQHTSGVVALPAKLPSFAQFIHELTAAINDYNTRHHHSALPKLDGVNHATPAEYRAARMPEGGVLIPDAKSVALLFMPGVLRTPARGEVKLLNNRYYHSDLMLAPEGQVRVHFDIHDARRVWVRRLTGELIAVAELNGNSADFFDRSYVAQLEDKRRAGKIQRLQEKVQDAIEEQSVRTFAPSALSGVPLPAPVQRVAVQREDTAEEAAAREALAAEMAASNVTELKRREPDDEWAPYRRCKAIETRLAEGGAVSAEDAAWCASYQRSADYRTFAAMAVDFPQMVQPMMGAA